MFDVIKDAYNEYNDSVKKIKINELCGIYIKPNAEKSLFFEKYNDFWTYEDNDSNKYDYKFDENATIESLVEQLKNNYTFDDEFKIRLYDKDFMFIKTIYPGNRKLISKELFGNYELNRLREVNENIYKDDPEALKVFENQMKIVYTDVSQLVRLISSQAHTNETLRITMSLAQSILAGVPITDITDDNLSKDDWVTTDEIDNTETLKNYLEIDGYTIKEIYTNIRCTRIIKVIYTNNETNEDEVFYYDTNASVYIDTNENEAYFGKESIASIEMPWSFTPINEVTFDETNISLKDNMIKFSDVDA